MKKKTLFSALLAGTTMLAGMVTTACSTDGDDYAGDVYSMESSAGHITPGGKNGGEGGESDNAEAGIVTAGEWSDLKNWAFWSRLMLGEDYGDKSDYWQMYTNNRVALRVTNDAGEPQAGVEVLLQRQSGDKLTTVWQTVTDNHGEANCWPGLLQKETAGAAELRVSLDGRLMEGRPTVCAWDSLAETHAVNHYVVNRKVAARRQADIAFVVDATGSMTDEINFLKSDLVDIIGRAQQMNTGTTMRTAALFYRDEGDDYLTRHADFTTDLSQTAQFVSRQSADGGGDYPEAVHTALTAMLQDLSWSSNARTRLAFMLLDAPAHHEDDVIRSLQQSIVACAAQGIRLIPVAASGVDKDTEFMLRFFAITTGGTYVFLTNDSGVGLDHIAPTVGQYEVEHLNDLIIRLIDYYTE